MRKYMKYSQLIIVISPSCANTKAEYTTTYDTKMMNELRINCDRSVNSFKLKIHIMVMVICNTINSKVNETMSVHSKMVIKLAFSAVRESIKVLIRIVTIA